MIRRLYWIVLQNGGSERERWRSGGGEGCERELRVTTNRTISEGALGQLDGQGRAPGG